MIRRIVCACVLVVAVSAMSIPAAHAATSPSTWAAKFCTSLEKWQKTITAESKKATDALDVTSGGDLSAIRAEFVSFLKKDVDATKAAIKSIASAGAPDVSNGSKIQSKVLAGLRSTSDVFSGAQQDAAALSTTDATAFVNDASAIDDKLTNAADGFTNAINDAQNLDKDNKIGAAFAKAKACKAL